MSWTSDPRALRPLMPRPPHFCHNPKLINSWSDYGGQREMPLVSSRWNPTPEQVQALQEMYRRGTRTPSADQIQQIAATLRRFGKIQGKNVFYWFQNHKARDRQKKRRQLQLFAAKDNHTTKQSGLSRKYLEMEQAKKVATMSKCSTASKYYGREMEECKRERWAQAQIDSRETPLELSSSCISPNKNIISQENGCPLIALKLLPQKTHDFKHGMGENPTLELFPVNGNGGLKEEEMDDAYLSTRLVPNQFFEFLPTKN